MRSASATTTSPRSVLLALGSNVGNRTYWLRRAVAELEQVISVVRLSEIMESEAVDAPPGSGPFLNGVLAGVTRLAPEQLLVAIRGIEAKLGRRRGGRNAPRNIDIDIIFYGAELRRSETLMLPHPRFREREFVMKPLRELRLGWVDPRTGEVF